MMMTMIYINIYNVHIASNQNKLKTDQQQLRWHHFDVEYGFAVWKGKLLDKSSIVSCEIFSANLYFARLCWHISDI